MYLFSKNVFVNSLFLPDYTHNIALSINSSSNNNVGYYDKVTKVKNEAFSELSS